MPRHAGDTRARLFTDTPLPGVGRVFLTADQTHYLHRVLRLDTGAPVALFNGVDGEWRCTIAEMARSACILAVDRQLREQTPEPDLWLIYAPMKKNRMDFLVEKATELGVSCLWPVLTRNTDAGRVNTDRVRAQAIEAAEQCERLSVPIVEKAIALPKLLANWPEERPLLVADETGGGTPVAEVVKSLAGRACAIVIGPPGGFDASELDVLRKQPFVSTIGLGPRILRAETAALSVLAVWQAVAGDWQNGVPDRD